MNRLLVLLVVFGLACLACAPAVQAWPRLFGRFQRSAPPARVSAPVVAPVTKAAEPPKDKAAAVYPTPSSLVAP